MIKTFPMQNRQKIESTKLSLEGSKQSKLAQKTSLGQFYALFHVMLSILAAKKCFSFSHRTTCTQYNSSFSRWPCSFCPLRIFLKITSQPNSMAQIPFLACTKTPYEYLSRKIDFKIGNLIKNLTNIFEKSLEWSHELRVTTKLTPKFQPPSSTR